MLFRPIYVTRPLPTTPTPPDPGIEVNANAVETGEAIAQGVSTVLSGGTAPGNVNVHYVRNTRTGEGDDFKIVMPGPRPTTPKP